MNRFLVASCLILTISHYSQGQSETIKLTEASNTFSQDLYQKIAINESNVCYSPFSIHLALSVAFKGSRQDTLREMRLTLRLNKFITDSPHEAYNQVIITLLNTPSVKITTANALFLSPSRTIKSAYQNDVSRLYQAIVTNYNLSYPGGPVEEINDFVENKTNGLIKDLLQPDSIDSKTLLVIINTLFFNGTWEKRFSEKRTNKSDFFTPKGTIQVETMFDERFVDLKRDFHGADVAQLNFTGGRFSLVLVHPHSVKDFKSFEKKLTNPRIFENIFKGLNSTNVNLALPKVKIESTFKLNDALKALGMDQAFDPIKADFARITNDGAFIDAIAHKAVIRITETGTVAAASTSVVIGARSLSLPPTESFIVNSPFLFFLRDNSQILVLFQGKFTGN